MFIHQDRIRYDEEWQVELWLDIDKIIAIQEAKENRYRVITLDERTYIIEQETFDKIIAEKGMI